MLYIHVSFKILWTGDIFRISNTSYLPVLLVAPEDLVVHLHPKMTPEINILFTT